MAGAADEAAEPNHAPRATQVPGQAHQQIPDLDVRPGRGMAAEAAATAAAGW